MDDWKPQTEREKAQDVDARREVSWHERKRANLPRLHVAIDAALQRLETEEDEAKREKIESLLAALEVFRRRDYEYTAEDLDEQLRLIKAL